MSKSVGIYIGRDEIVAVSAVYSARGPLIKAYAIEPVHPAEKEGPELGKGAGKFKKLTPEAQAIRKALEKIKETGAFVTVSVSPIYVVTRQFMMPAVPKKEMDKAVRFEASRYIPFKSSESVIDHHEQMSHKSVYSVTVTAIRKEVLQQSLDDLRAASAKVLMVEPVHLAVSRVFASLNMFQKVKTCGFVTLQSDGNVNLTFAAKGVIYLSRDFLFSGNSEEDKPRFFEELKASLDYFYKLTGGEAVSQIFVCGHGDLKFWVEYLEHAFNYSLRFDLATFPSENKVPEPVRNSIFVAYGLALRSLGYKSPFGDVELLPPEERRMKPLSFFSFLAGEILVIALIVLIIRLFAFQPYIADLSAQYQKIFAPTSGIDPRVADMPLASLSSHKTALASQIAILNNFEKQRTVPSELLTALGQGLPKSIWIDYVSIENDMKKKKKNLSKNLNVRGICYLGNAEKEAATVNAWFQTLATKDAFKKRFSDIKLDEIKREKLKGRDVTRFKIFGESSQNN